MGQALAGVRALPSSSLRMVSTTSGALFWLIFRFAMIRGGTRRSPTVPRLAGKRDQGPEQSSDPTSVGQGARQGASQPRSAEARCPAGRQRGRTTNDASRLPVTAVVLFVTSPDGFGETLNSSWRPDPAMAETARRRRTARSSRAGGCCERRLVHSGDQAIRLRAGTGRACRPRNTAHLRSRIRTARSSAPATM